MGKKAIWLVVFLAMILPAEVLSSPGYNRDAAIGYADLYCRNYHPNYNCGWPGDCQNFASQVLNAGGVPMVGWWRWDHRHWFFVNCSWYANSWTVNSWFDRHAAYWTSRYQNVGWQGKQRADPVLFKFPWCSDWCHTAIYMGWGMAWEGSKAGQWCELRSQHSPSRCRVWWWEDVPSGTYLKVWHVIY